MAVCTSYGQVGSETGVLAYERLWRRDGSRRGAIFCHGHAAFSWDYVSFPDPLMQALVNAGVPCVATELGGVASWGNAAAVTAMANAFSQLVSQLGAKADRPLIVCYSMGNLPAFVYAASNPVAAIVSEAPAVDLAALHDGNIGGWAAEIETAYGGLAGYQAAVAAHNPVMLTSSLKGVPARLYYGDTGGGSDGLLPVSMAQSFAASIGGVASSVGNVVHQNVPGAVPVADAAAFLLAHA